MQIQEQPLTQPIFHSVALLSPPYSTLTYVRPGYLPHSRHWQAGTRVLMPLGRGHIRLGVLVDGGQAQNTLPEGVSAKALLWPAEAQSLLSEEHLAMVRELSLRQLTPAGQILAAVLPAGLRSLNQRLRVFTPGEAPKRYLPRELARLAPEALLAVAKAWENGEAQWLLAAQDAASTELCALSIDPPWPVRPAAKRQREVLEFLYEHGLSSRRALTAALGPESAAALASLVKHGHVSIRSGELEEPEPGSCLVPPTEFTQASFTLSAAQQDAIVAFKQALDAGQAATHLLYGVTGSGKTAVYLELVRECLHRGRSVLLLAPEVALAIKLRRDVLAFMPQAPLFFFHGYQSPQKREAVFRELAARTQPSVVVGTRSALFLPAADIGAIILDEEHDASFKQDEGLPYQAKELAWFRAAQHKALLVLGSATPDIKTFYAAREGHIPVAALPARVSGNSLPHIDMVDLRSVNVAEGLLAAETRTALRETLKKGEQAVVLLNRRGYAPVMYCLDCGKAARCPHCDIGLTYHKGRERLVCHYCGHSVPFPALCLHCKGQHYLPMGEGTERLEEQLSGLLPPGGRVLRLDRDTTRRPGSMESILESFAREEAQVLVGTQMLSKGHHFPKVTLAIIADADVGLNIPDYRAAERTFQLLVQSSGRSGRGEKAGRVIIQTRDTAHYCWNYVQEADYEGFYAQEIALREKRRYPPFIRLALVRLSFPAQWDGGVQLVQEVGALLRKLGRGKAVTVLGPAPSPMALIRARKRFQCLLKAGDWQAIRAVYSALVQSGLCRSKDARLSLDIDPVNML